MPAHENFFTLNSPGAEKEQLSSEQCFLEIYKHVAQTMEWVSNRKRVELKPPPFCKNKLRLLVYSPRVQILCAPATRMINRETNQHWINMIQIIYDFVFKNLIVIECLSFYSIAWSRVELPKKFIHRKSYLCFESRAQSTQSTKLKDGVV